MPRCRRVSFVLVLLCALAVACTGIAAAQDSLLFYTWARPEEMDDYKPIFDKFEAETGLKVEVQGFAGAYFNGAQPLAQVLEDVERQMQATLTELGIIE